MAVWSPDQIDRARTRPFWKKGLTQTEFPTASLQDVTIEGNRIIHKKEFPGNIVVNRPKQV
jgi:hypothetical protein